MFNRNQSYAQEKYKKYFKEDLLRFNNDEYVTYWLGGCFTPEWYVRKRSLLNTPSYSENFGMIDPRKKKIDTIEECF